MVLQYFQHYFELLDISSCKKIQITFCYQLDFFYILKKKRFISNEVINANLKYDISPLLIIVDNLFID